MKFSKPLQSFLGLGLIVLATSLFSPSVFLGPDHSLLSRAHAGFFNQDLELFEEIVDLIQDKYVYPPNFKTMFSGAIEEMVQFIKDENLKLDTLPSGQSLAWKNNRIWFQLNYDQDKDMRDFRRVFYFLLDESKGNVKKAELEVAAINGMMNSLDPYSQFMDKETFEKSMRDTEGKYGGLGMVITMKDKKLVIVRTMKDSPAERAGILPDDVFVSANGQEVRSMQIRELAESLRGFPNTKATFTLFRPSENREKTYTLTREIIEIETVTYEKLEDQIAHIRIASFSKQTNDQLEAALDQAKKDGALSFILDLRDNPGGLLTQSVKVASHFTSDDRLIVYTKGRDAGQYQEYHAENKGNLQNMPVVILVNQYSASASEIVAGALRDAGKALVMGETSYGKGSVQTIFRINDGAGLRITTSKYFTPSGIDITEYGIIPDIMIEKTDPEPAGDPKPGEERIKPKPSLPGLPAIRLKLSDVTKLLQDQGIVVDNGHDPLLRFAQSTIKNIRVANKKVTLEKARELAANIQYESTPLNR